MYRVFRFEGFCVSPQLFTGIRIDVESWEIATCYINTDEMISFEQVAKGREREIYFVNFPRFHHFRLQETVSVAGPDY